MSLYYAGAIDFKTAGGTASASTIEQSTERESPISVWLTTPQAKEYEGQWVVLNQQMTPIDADLSPTVLQRRYEATDTDVAIVFVRPTSVQIGA